MASYKGRILLLALCALAGWLLYCVVSAYYRVGDYPGKVWLHRCNSIEKLKEKSGMYPNVEVDVVYRNNGVLDVTHDEDTTFNLNLEEYFSHYSEQAGKMWIDIKNMDCSNRDSIKEALVSLMLRYGIGKERLIIESRDWESLAQFTKDGFYTSYYIPYGKPSDMDGQQMEECITHLESVAGSGSVKALSFPYWWYRHIRGRLDAGVDMLTWKHRSSQFLFLLSGEGKRMLEDERLKVVLVKDKGNFHR